MIKKGITYLIIFLSILTACKRKDKFDITTSKINLELKIKRLDKDIFEIDPGNVAEELPALIENYGEFYELYSMRIINLGNPYQEDYPEILAGFVTDYTMNKVFEKTMNVFPTVKNIETSLQKAFKRYKFYFPDRIVPQVYTYIGGFNQSMVVSDSILGIGVDKYLGKECEFYDRLGIANYLQKNMNPENIPTDAVKAWALTEFLYNDSIDNLVNNMIYQGKIQYFLDAMFPKVADTLKMGFTSDQMRWCIKNEKQMWNYLIENKLLFTTDYMTINQHINPAPFTSGYPNDSPGRASVWLGWQIVKEYMRRNSGITLNELMLNDDYQAILSESRYEP
jgi:gliding motility-associated lipoprotein GldB